MLLTLISFLPFIFLRNALLAGYTVVSSALVQTAPDP